MSTNDLPNSSPEGTIPVSQAMQMTANWRKYLESSEQVFNVRSYLIPIIDFQNILKYNPDAEAVRAYLGLGDAGDPATSQLLLVPIVDGKEVIYLSTADKVGGKDGDDGDSNIYDLTNPCPPQCGSGTGDGLDG